MPCDQLKQKEKVIYYKAGVNHFSEDELKLKWFESTASPADLMHL